jgi:hypothetical protein
MSVRLIASRSTWRRPSRVWRPAGTTWRRLSIAWRQGRTSWADIGVTLLVALVAAAASYGHMLHVARPASEPRLIAYAWPIIVESLALAALLRGECGGPRVAGTCCTGARDRR